MDKSLGNTNFQCNYTSVNNTIKEYSLFPNDKVFYISLIVVVFVMVVFGILLFSWMFCQPSNLNAELFTRSNSTNFLYNKSIRNNLTSGVSITNLSNKTRCEPDCENKAVDIETPMQEGNRHISILDTHLPPLASQGNGNVKPKEIMKLRNHLEKIENRDGYNHFNETGRRPHQKQLERLDVTSLTHVDDGFE